MQQGSEQHTDVWVRSGRTVAVGEKLDIEVVRVTNGRVHIRVRSRGEEVQRIEVKDD